MQEYEVVCNAHRVVFLVWWVLSMHGWVRCGVGQCRLLVVFKDPGGTETELAGSLANFMPSVNTLFLGH